MNLKRFENKALQSFWGVHIEAWHRSELSQSAYCRQHRISARIFARWLKYLAGKEAGVKQAQYLAQLRREQRRAMQQSLQRSRARLRFSVSMDDRNRALQAFWAMHVEAMNWSGMGVREYAAALELSPTSLRKWRNRLDERETEIDWRAHLHPSARPVVGTSANGRELENRLTDVRKDDPPQQQPPVRRFFSDEEKRAIALESDQPGVSVSAVARRHGIVTGLLFRWRVQFGVAQKKRARLAAVAHADAPTGIAVLYDLLQPPDGMMVVDLPDGRRVFAPDGSDPVAVCAHVAAREADT